MANVVLKADDGEDVVFTPKAWAEHLPSLIEDVGDDAAALAGLITTAVDAGMAAHLEPAATALQARIDAGDAAEGNAAVAIAAYFVARGRRAEADAVVDAALKHHRTAEVLLARAKLFSLGGDEKEAEIQLDAALDVDPNHASTVGLKIARGLARGGDAGARNAMQAIAKRKGAWLAHVRLGAMADAGKAATHLQAAKKAAGDDAHPIGLCLRVFLRRGEAEEALTFIGFDALDRAAQKASAGSESERLVLDVDERILVPTISALVATERMQKARAYLAHAKEVVTDRLLLAELGEVELALTRQTVNASDGGKVTSVPTSAPLHGAVLQDFAPAPVPPQVVFLSFSVARGPEQEAPTRDKGGVPHASTEQERHVRGLPLWFAEKLFDAGVASAVSTTLAADAGFYSPTSAWTLPLLLAFAPKDTGAMTRGLLVSGHVSTPSDNMVSVTLAVFDLAKRKQVRTPPVLGATVADAAAKALAQIARAQMGVSGTPPKFTDDDSITIEDTIGHLADLQALFFVASQTLNESAAWHSVRALDAIATSLAKSPSEATVKRAAAAYACAKALRLGGRDQMRAALNAVGTSGAMPAPLAKAIDVLTAN